MQIQGLKEMSQLILIFCVCLIFRQKIVFMFSTLLKYGVYEQLIRHSLATSNCHGISNRVHSAHKCI